MADAKRDFEALLKRLAAPDRPGSPTLVPGATIAGRYRIIRLLGRGGMGEVYEVEESETGLRRALKCLLGSLADDDAARLRFEAETAVARRLDHPNIVKVSAAGSLPDGRPYLCMELLFGRSLQRELECTGQIGEARLSTIAQALCDALSAAHGQGLIHRDLKPANVILVQLPAAGELVKLTDFGVAKRVRDPMGHVTTTGVVLGTPHFMSPEQVRGERDLDGRTDLYSLGVLLYYCATGAFPFQGKAFAQLAMEICSATPPAPRALRPELSPAFEAIIQTAMARDPAQRFASAALLKRALELADHQDSP